jgi:hypothetical protein
VRNSAVVCKATVAEKFGLYSRGSNQHVDLPIPGREVAATVVTQVFIKSILNKEMQYTLMVSNTQQLYA